jgi:hypothetical protein
MIAKNFIGNFDPAKAKEFTPVYKLEFTDTPFTVKSDGIELKRYLVTEGTGNPDFTTMSNLTLVDTLTTNIIGFYSESGAMLGFHYSDNFALHYSCYFYADYPVTGGTYVFKAYGYGKIRVKIHSTYIIGSADFIDIDPLGNVDNDSGSIRLKPKSWYKLDVYYYSPLGDSGFSLLWSSTYYGQDRFIPVSAGVCSKNGSFLTATTIEDVISVSREEGKGEISTLTFSVPLVISGSTSDGYYYNSYWDKYCHSTQPIALDKFKMVEFSAGYLLGGTEDYVKKFIGHIESFNPQRGDNNIIEVRCNGFENLYKQTINLNYPSMYDYWNADYAGRAVSPTTPDGIGCPVTYDGWALHKVIQSLSIHSNIDPYLFMQKKYHLNNAGNIVSGTWLIEETSPNSVMLDTNINYGNSAVINTDVGSIADEEYIVKSNFGDTLFDYANTITDVYGWNWGTDPYYNGAPYLRSNNNPYAILTAKKDAVKSGNYWTKTADLSTLSGNYYSTNNAGDYLEFSFPGAKLNLVIVGSNDSGIETHVTCTTDNVDITVEDASSFSVGNIVIIETLLGEESAVIENIVGNVISIEDELTSNPKNGGYLRLATCKAELVRGTTFSGGTLVQTTYHSCYFNNSANRLIPTTGLKDNVTSVVETKRYYYDGTDPQTSVNPTVINIAKGLSYDNYVLRISRLTNTQAGITNYLRIDSLAVFDKDTDKIVKTFYTGDNVVSGTVVSLNVIDSGADLRNDTIVVGRMLGVDVPGDLKDASLNPNNPTYSYILSRATDVGSIYDPYAINYIGMPRQTIQIAPEIASYDRAKYWAVNFVNRYRYPGKYPEFEIIGNPLLEENDCIAVVDEGKETLQSYDKFWITSITETYEDKNYITQIATTSYEPWESYSPKTTPDINDYNGMSITNLVLKNGGDGSKNYPTGISTYLNQGGYYDPYSHDDNGLAITIQYDLIVDAYVKIDVYNEERNDLPVATLINASGSAGTEGWLRQEPGKKYVVTWDGVDLYGDWNKYCTEDLDEPIGKGFFAHEGKNPRANGSGKFYFQFTIIRRDQKGPSVIFSYDSRLLSANNRGYVYIKRGGQSLVSMYSDPHCWFYKLTGTTPPATPRTWETRSLVYPNVCFHDSKIVNTVPMNAQISFRNETSNTEQLKRVSSWYANANAYDYQYYKNRKLQITVKMKPCVYVVGSYNSGNFQQGFYPRSEIVIYSHDAFLSYDVGIDKYFDLRHWGYSYGKYAPYFEATYFNKLKAANTSYVAMAIWLWVEIFAYDKSGRRCWTLVPNHTKTGNTNVANGFWLFWLGDSKPYETEKAVGGINDGSNASGYPWIKISSPYEGVTLPDTDGTELLNYIMIESYVRQVGGEITGPSYNPEYFLVKVYENKVQKSWIG